MKLRKRYVIEYVDDQKILDRIYSGTEDKPWELYKTRVFEEKSAHKVYTGETGIDGEAWEIFILWSIAGDVCLPEGKPVLECKMWMELLNEDGESVYEDLCELPSTIRYTFRTAVMNSMRKELEQANNNVDQLAKELETYRKFTEKYHADELFRQFIRENGFLKGE